MLDLERASGWRPHALPGLAVEIKEQQLLAHCMRSAKLVFCSLCNRSQIKFRGANPKQRFLGGSVNTRMFS